MYAVLTPPGEGRRQWLAWMAAFVSLLALVVSVVTACVAVQQLDRVTEVEQKMIEMKMHFERLLNEYDYDIYDYDDPKVCARVLFLVVVPRTSWRREADLACVSCEFLYILSLGGGGDLSDWFYSSF